MAGKLGQRHLLREGHALRVEGDAALGPGPCLGQVRIERLAARGTLGAVADTEARDRTVRIGDIGAVGILVRLPELHHDAGHARLVVLGARLGRVVLVAGAVVADGADDAAVLVSGVRLHAPVDFTGEADDREHVEVDLARKERRRRRLVVGPERDAGRLVAGVERLEHHELRKRVDLIEVVLAVFVRRLALLALVVQRVVATSHRQIEPGHADFPGLAEVVLAVAVQVGVVLLAVAVRVDEDRAADVGEPTGEAERADVGVLAGHHVDLGGGDDEVLLLIEHRDDVLARRAHC